MFNADRGLFQSAAFEATTFTYSLTTGDNFLFAGASTKTKRPPFAGFISDVPISSLTIEVARLPTDEEIAGQIDRFQFGPVVVPEPSSFCFVVAVVALGILKRRWAEMSARNGQATVAAPLMFRGRAARSCMRQSPTNRMRGEAQ